jgi:hypothetical protein
MGAETSLERIERLAYAAAGPSADDIARLTRERDEARAYLKAFVYATIAPEDRCTDVQVHQANPSLGWIFTLNDTGMRGQREILGSQVRRAMEIVGFDKLKIEPAGTTVADDLAAAQGRIARLEANLMTCARSAFYAGYSEGVARGIAACTDDDDEETVDIEGAWQKSVSRHIAKLGIVDAKAART